MAAKIFLDLKGGVKMPAIGIGTWQSQNEAELVNALEACLEAGYRHIDTAYVYENEKMIGKVLKKWFSEGKIKREDLFITTKLPLPGIHPDRVEMFMKKSLENLQLDYVDLYLIHFAVGIKYIEGQTTLPLNPNGDIATEPIVDHVAIWKKMEEQVDAGRTKKIGLSNFNVKQISKICDSARIKPANLQVELHLYLQQKELINYCKKNDITVVAYSPLGSPGYNTFLKNMGKSQRDDLPDILNDKTIKKLSEKYSKTPAQIALRFLLQYGVAAIPKSVTPKRVKENIDVFDFTIDQEDMNTLYKLDVGEKARVCDFLAFPGIDKHPEFPFPKQ